MKKLKTVKTSDHSFRVEVVPNEMLGTEITSSSDYFSNWVKSCSQNNNDYDSMSEREKKDYQEKFFETKRVIWEESDGEIKARFELSLNSDWTWNVVDLKTNIEYQHCYPVLDGEDLNTNAYDENTILYLPASVIDKHYYNKLGKINDEIFS